MRLDKCLTAGGQWSRSQIKIMIRAGRITVDGKSALRPEMQVDPDRQEICVDGESISYSNSYCVMVYKPAGVLTATEDKRDKTVLDLLPERFQKLGLFPAGRLDKDSEGFVLMTNDGALAHGLMSPKRHVDKIYYVKVQGKLSSADVDAFKNGLEIDGGDICAPAELDIINSGEISEARVTLREGKFHQIKRMFSARGQCVIYLKRESIAGVELDKTLEPCGFRELTPDEEKRLRTACGL